MPANLLTDDVPEVLAEEQFDLLLRRPGVRLERIVSTGQVTLEGQWLSQDHEEWVMLLAGAAGLTLEGETTAALAPGDCRLISPGRRHRVEWTSADPPAVWLALHLGEHAGGADF
jgi:cupin 2 domain-containing protein